MSGVRAHWVAVDPVETRPGYMGARLTDISGGNEADIVCAHPHESAPEAWACAQEKAAVLNAAHIALDSRLARSVREALERRLGKGMVTDDIVRITVAALIAESEGGPV